eukprot:TRINITY_DN4899_c0_g1_i2.p1 TRINITY_DN4899_c0_g1~~TRINITY_DN4899_c0_g1_i2.p1  ORF type:complete len:747 (-),score=121.89 TRINITY_DN4899_c0_g1_i2:115-2355(-)
MAQFVSKVERVMKKKAVEEMKSAFQEIEELASKNEEFEENRREAAERLAETVVHILARKVKEVKVYFLERTMDIIRSQLIREDACLRLVETLNTATAHKLRWFTSQLEKTQEERRKHARRAGRMVALTTERAMRRLLQSAFSMIRLASEVPSEEDLLTAAKELESLLYAAQLKVKLDAWKEIRAYIRLRQERLIARLRGSRVILHKIERSFQRLVVKKTFQKLLGNVNEKTQSKSFGRKEIAQVSNLLSGLIKKRTQVAIGQIKNFKEEAPGKQSLIGALRLSQVLEQALLKRKAMGLRELRVVSSRFEVSVTKSRLEGTFHVKYLIAKLEFLVHKVLIQSFTKIKAWKHHKENLVQLGYYVKVSKEETVEGTIPLERVSKNLIKNMSRDDYMSPCIRKNLESDLLVHEVSPFGESQNQKEQRTKEFLPERVIRIPSVEIRHRADEPPYDISSSEEEQPQRESPTFPMESSKKDNSGIKGKSKSTLLEIGVDPPLVGSNLRTELVYDDLKHLIQTSRNSMELRSSFEKAAMRSVKSAQQTVSYLHRSDKTISISKASRMKNLNMYPEDLEMMQLPLEYTSDSEEIETPLPKEGGTMSEILVKKGKQISPFQSKKGKANANDTKSNKERSPSDIKTKIERRLIEEKRIDTLFRLHQSGRLKQDRQSPSPSPSVMSQVHAFSPRVSSRSFTADRGRQGKIPSAPNIAYRKKYENVRSLATSNSYSKRGQARRDYVSPNNRSPKLGPSP